MKNLSHDKAKKIVEDILYSCNDLYRHGRDTHTESMSDVCKVLPFTAFNNTFYIKISTTKARHNSPNLYGIEYQFLAVEEGHYSKITPAVEKKFYDMSSVDRIHYNTYFVKDFQCATERDFINQSFGRALARFEERYKEDQDSLRKQSRKCFATLKSNMNYFDKYFADTNHYNLFKKHLNIVKKSETYEEYDITRNESQIPYSHMFSQTISLLNDYKRIVNNQSNVVSFSSTITIDLSDCEMGKIIEPVSRFKMEQDRSDTNSKMFRETIEQIFMEQIPDLMKQNGIQYDWTTK